MPFSDAIFGGTAPSVAAIVAGIYDELIANARVALSYGQRWKDAIGLDTFTAARITDISKISSAAIAVGDTANSIAQKLRGATDNQAFASAAGMVISSFDNADFSMTASQTVDIIPATGESDVGMILVRTQIGGSDEVRASADSGVNYAAIAIQPAGLNHAKSFSDAGDWVPIIHIGNSTGRYRVVTAVSVGTRNFVRMITTVR